MFFICFLFSTLLHNLTTSQIESKRSAIRNSNLAANKKQQQQQHNSFVELETCVLLSIHLRSP